MLEVTVQNESYKAIVKMSSLGYMRPCLEGRKERKREEEKKGGRKRRKAEGRVGIFLFFFGI